MEDRLEYWITKKGKDGEYYLHSICGASIQHAENVLEKTKKEFPQDEFRIESDMFSNCWWKWGFD